MDWIVENILKNNYLINWLSAIGTIGAVWVSLWLAIRDDKRKGELKVKGIQEPASVMHPYRRIVDPIPIISCEVYNHSKFPITISSIKIRVLKKNGLKKEVIGSAILLMDEEFGEYSKLPMKVGPFEKDTWIYSKYLLNNYIKSDIIPKIENENKKEIFIEFQAIDSFGKNYNDIVKIDEKEIKKYLPQE